MFYSLITKICFVINSQILRQIGQSNRFTQIYPLQIQNTLDSFANSNLSWAKAHQ